MALRAACKRRVAGFYLPRAASFQGQCA